MPAPKGVKFSSRAPLTNRGGKRDRAGRKPSQSHADRFKSEPDGTATVRLPNRLLAALEGKAQAEGMTITELLQRDYCA